MIKSLVALLLSFVIVGFVAGIWWLVVAQTERETRFAQVDRLEQSFVSQAATLQRIEATVSALAETSDLDAKFTENLAQTLLEVREYARGSACLSWYMSYILELVPEEAFEYFVRRPLTDCEAKQQEAQ